MSTKSKLLAMTEGLQLPPETPAPSLASGTMPPAEMAPPVPTAPTRFPPVVPGAAKTGPGQMLQFRGQILAAESELGKLRDRLKAHEGSLPTRKLDPSQVIPSRWSNRHPDTFQTPDFHRLKQDIELAGGNVQPICVRPAADQSERYEIVFGHRRHRACSELGLPVLAMIEVEPISDLELFSAMDRENRERADLSPFEQGAMYRRALDEKLYPSNRRLAEALGVSHTWVANVLMVVDLPPPIVECFRSPLEIQHRHAKAIHQALETDRKGVLRRAEKLRVKGKQMAAAAVIDALTGSELPTARPTSIEVDGKKLGSWKRDKAGWTIIKLDPMAVPEDRLADVLNALKQGLG